MKKVFIILILLYLNACSSDQNKPTKPTESTLNEIILTVDSNDEELETPHSIEQIIGERIDGPANIRDTIDGKILFELFDNVLVETSPLKNNWLTVGIFVKTDSNLIKTGYILPYQKLLDENGKIIGETKDTVQLIMDGGDSWLIWGETFKNNI